MANKHPDMSGLKPIKKGEVRNPKGRQKKLVNAIKSLPDDMQEKVYSILGYALTLPDTTTAREYLSQQEGQLGKYGVVMQIAIKQLLHDNMGWYALMDILDRLYGKPRISAEVTHQGGISLNITTDQETKDLIEGGLG